MRYFLSLVFVFAFGNHCFAQNERLSLSSVINSIYFSKDGLDIKDTKEKMFFCMSIKKDTKIPNLEDVLDFDSFNSNKFELLYANDEKKILQILKKNNFIDVIHTPTCQMDVDNLVLILDIGSIDYKLFKKSKFKFTMRGDVFKIHYKSINNKWIVDHIDRI
jgi:hypothetical protein